MTLASSPLDTIKALGHIESSMWSTRETNTEGGAHYTFSHLSPRNVVALAHLVAAGKWNINIKGHHGGIRLTFRDIK